MNTTIDKDRVWGIGLGRTATRSLCEALRTLGYDDVFHVPPFIESVDNVDAAVEGVCISHFRYLDLRFPGSKFILTTRDIDAWLASCERAMADFPHERIEQKNKFYNPMIRNRSARYGTLEYDRDVLLHRFYQHHYEVVSHFAGRMDQLLILDITKGRAWSKLCDFLEVDGGIHGDFSHISGKDGLK